MQYHVIPRDRFGATVRHPVSHGRVLHKWSVKWTRCTWSVWECFETEWRRGIRKPNTDFSSPLALPLFLASIRPEEY